MSDRDIFDEFEKSIDDAFKPDEKERVKNKNGYMFNEVYDKMLRDKWKSKAKEITERIAKEHSHYDYSRSEWNHMSSEWNHNHAASEWNYPSNSYIVNDQLKCSGCGNILNLNILVKDEPVRYHSILDRPLYFERNQYFCPICGGYFATKGKLVKINVEVRQEWQ
jgi:hypothetical protein